LCSSYSFIISPPIYFFGFTQTVLTPCCCITGQPPRLRTSTERTLHSRHGF
jgi:hypothetical protein